MLVTIQGMNNDFWHGRRHPATKERITDLWFLHGQRFMVCFALWMVYITIAPNNVAMNLLTMGIILVVSLQMLQAARSTHTQVMNLVREEDQLYQDSLRRQAQTPDWVVEGASGAAGVGSSEAPTMPMQATH